MRVTPERVSPQHGIYALGVLCFGLGVVHLLTDGEGVGTALETFIICTISLIILVTGYDFPDRSISEAGRWRVLRMAVTVSVSFSLLALAIWLIWFIEGDPTEFSFLVAFAASLGGAVGTRGGLYAVEANERLDEARDLTKLLTINQRVLRHNLRNDLSVVMGTLDNIERRAQDEETLEDVESARAHLETLLETTDRTREIVSIWNTERVVTFELQSLLRDQIATVATSYPDVEIATEFDGDCRVESHAALPTAIEEALRNAVEHTPAGAPVTVCLATDEAGSAVIEVSDVGEGVPKFDADAIGGSEEKPLVHTQGLGLWIIYWTVKMSEGTFELRENDPEGTTVRITLPTAAGR